MTFNLRNALLAKRADYKHCEVEMSLIPEHQQSIGVEVSLWYSSQGYGLWRKVCGCVRQIGSRGLNEQRYAALSLKLLVANLKYGNE